MKYSRDIFYLLALSLVVIGGCATPLGKFNKKDDIFKTELFAKEGGIVRKK